MADGMISKIKLADGTTVEIKDKTGRENFDTLLGNNTLAALKTAAWRDVAAAISDGDGKIADAATVKAYVDAQIESIPTFECVVCPAQADQIPAGAEYYDSTTEPATSITGTMAASENTYKKIYLVKNDKLATGTYVEYLTIRSGAKGSYTYTWEAIGSTKIDLSNYVQKSTTIAGISLSADITSTALQSALGLESLAYADTATGTSSISTIDAITMKTLTVAGNATVTSSDAEATLTKADYTPAGTVTGSMTPAGTVSVVLGEVSAEAEISYTSYTPAGTISATATGSFSALKTATFGLVSDGAAGAVQIEGTVTKPAVSVSAPTQTVLQAVSVSAVLPSFVEGAFDAGSVAFGTFTANTPTKVDTTKFNGGSLTAATTSGFAKTGLVASVNTSAASTAEDFELLVFSSATVEQAIIEQGAFTSAAFSEGFYTAGASATWTGSSYTPPSKEADTWDAGASAVFSTSSVVQSVDAELAETPAFTGKWYANAVTSDVALKEVAFSGTAANVKTSKVVYMKPTVSSATFSGTKGDISATFSGSVAASVLTTGVSYKKADSTAAFSVDVTPEVSALSSTTKTISITVNPD